MKGPALDISAPSIAGRDDAALGGKDNFQVDREPADHGFERVRSARDVAAANRQRRARGAMAGRRVGFDQLRSRTATG